MILIEIFWPEPQFLKVGSALILIFGTIVASVWSCGVLVNTSFNVRGEPIVCTPDDAYRCFMRTEMDYLVIEDYLLDKKNQPQWQEKDEWRSEFELD